MASDTNFHLANFIWSICNLLRGSCKRSECRKVILPLNRHFYRHEPPRSLQDIQADIRKLESEIIEMPGEVVK